MMIELTLKIPGRDKDIKYSIPAYRKCWEDYFVQEADNSESSISKFLDWVKKDLQEKYGKTYDQWQDEQCFKYDERG